VNNTILTIATLLFSSSVWAGQSKSICGLIDDRTPSSEPRAGKLVKKTSKTSGCSGSLIGKNCMISAGHCTAHTYFAQFNQKANGTALPEDTYTVNRKTMVYADAGSGSDYSVFKLNPNPITGKSAGVAQGFYKVRYTPVSVSEAISVTGYGKDSEDLKTFTQQTHDGIIGNLIGTILYYDADTDSGNSGSGVILQATDELIGVHTNGGCYAYGGSNGGTSLAAHAKFKAAVEKCLASDL
jgi:V8-like Glu-specific endopeptidase